MNRPMMDIALNGRVALVTGGTRGIGLEIARQLGLRGYHTILAARSEAKGQRSARGLRELGHSSSAVALDVADHASIERAVSDTVGAFGRIEIRSSSDDSQFTAFTARSRLAWNPSIALSTKPEEPITTKRPASFGLPVLYVPAAPSMNGPFLLLGSFGFT